MAAGRPRARLRVPAATTSAAPRPGPRPSRWPAASSDRARRWRRSSMRRLLGRAATRIAGRDPRDARRGPRPGRGAGRHRDPGRGAGVAGSGADRRSATSPRPGASWPSRRDWPRRTAPAVHPARRRALPGSRSRSATGACEAAEAAAQQSLEWGRLLSGRDTSGPYGIQMFSIRREQGRLAELAPVVRILAAGERDGGPWRPGLAALLAELGDAGRGARASSTRVAADGLERLAGPLAGVAHLPRRRGLRGGRRRARRGALRRLPPRAGRRTSSSATAWPATAPPTATWACSPRRSAGTSDAERHLDVALALNRRMGARTWLAHTALRVRQAAAWPRSPSGRRRAAGASRGLAAASGMPALLAAHPGARAPAGRRCRCPTASRRARSQILRAGGAGPLEPRDRAEL